MSGGDLFGGERRFRGIGYAEAPGTGPAGETCRTCAHMTGRRFHKCQIGKVSSGANTDIRLSAPACRVWTAVGTTLCQTCVFYCPWNGAMGCSHSSVNRELGQESAPCKRIHFVRRRPVEIRNGRVLVDGQPLPRTDRKEGEPV